MGQTYVDSRRITDLKKYNYILVPDFVFLEKGRYGYELEKHSVER